MKTTAGRLDYVISLFESGCLCNCNEYDDIFDEDRNVVAAEIRHKLNCEGRLKARELLLETSEYDTEDTNGEV
ncbi:MAG: hypothetical protein V4440_05505 [Pseudomonadota bacterium]